MIIRSRIILLICAKCFITMSLGFSVLPPVVNRRPVSSSSSSSPAPMQLFATAEKERSTSTRKRVRTLTKELTGDKTQTQAEEQKNEEELWRVVLHNDEVHAFNYVIRSLCKIVG